MLDGRITRPTLEKKKSTSMPDQGREYKINNKQINNRHFPEINSFICGVRGVGGNGGTQKCGAVISCEDGPQHLELDQKRTSLFKKSNSMHQAQ